MSTNIISELMNDFRGDTLNQVASSLGENAAKMQTALGGVLPAVVAGLADKASTNEGASGLLDLIRRNKLDGGQFSDVSSAIKGPDGITNLINIGRPLMNSILGGRTTAVTDWVSSLAGINKTASSSLMSLVVPIVLSFIGRRVASSDGSASSLASLLASQKTFLQDAPAGMAKVLNFSDAAFVGTYDNQRRTVAEPVVAAYETKSTGSSWWMWALPVAALVALLGFFLSRRDDTQQSRARVAETARDTVAPVAGNLGTFIDKRLPSGIALNIPMSGIESKLINFIEDPSQKVDRETWFSFDRLEFETDSAQLKPSSQEQLRNVAEILKAHPQVTVKIGGYTDNVGDGAHNLKLSADRATNTRAAIVALGTDGSRLAAEGYGEKFPVADNTTEEGRQRNRRIDIRVTKK